MNKLKSPLAQQTASGMIILLVFGALSTIWPAILALFYGVLVLLQSCSADHEILALSVVEFWSLSSVAASLG